MKIEHLALWTNQLEAMKEFYCTYFGGVAGEKYVNHHTEFESYFITFDEGARIELMYTTSIVEKETYEMIVALGLTHFAVSVGSDLEVRRLTERLREHGFTVASDVRMTGDGYVESVILDPDGNCVEITI